MINDLVFVGFHSQVVALNRDTGETAWTRKSRKGTGYTTVLLDGDRLIVSVMGYTYCLDPRTGGELWFNPLKGFGAGVASLASVRGGTAGITPEAAAQTDEQQQSGAAAMI